MRIDPVRLALVLGLLLAGCPGPLVTDAGEERDAPATDASFDGGPNDGGPNDGGPNDGGPNDGGLSDGGPNDGGLSDSGPNDAGESSPGGVVVLTQSPDGPRSFEAQFVDVAIDQLLEGAFPGCVNLGAVGDCTHLSCSSLPTGTDDAGTVSATTVHGTTSIAFTPGSSYLNLLPDARFDAGDVVTFAADGALVPAFEESVIGPPALAVVLPTTMRRTEALVVSWAPTTAEHVTFTLSLPDTSSVLCRVPGTRGSVTVDASLFDSVAAGQTLPMSVATSNETHRLVGAWNVLFMLAQSRFQSATVE